MFIRKKRNATGSVSIQIIDKSLGKYKVFQTIGSSNDPEEIKNLVAKGKEIISRLHGQTVIDFNTGDDQRFEEAMIKSIDKVQLLGPELVLGKLFDEIGFNAIEDELFRHLVISRLIFPLSKLKTVDYIARFQGILFDVSKVYRYLDKLHLTQKQLVQRISYNHTLGILNNDLAVVFYDVTTLYFEAEEEDDLRKTGFSKEGKHQNPQILLGLLVSVNGYPLAYEIFEGNKFEGHTMLPVIEAFKKQYQLEKLVIIADAGLLSKDNIEQLLKEKYEFILGARIKNESDAIKNKILSLGLKDGESTVIEKEPDTKLVISFANSRAKKDEHNRKRGLAKLEAALSKGKLTKRHINNRGYNKYLTLKGEISISIDYEKYKDDARWDGLKGYITNTSLDKEAIIDNYKQLWHIEKAFRISKTDLRIRPIYHRLRKRIESHICIAFCAYKIHKELGRQLKLKKIGLSPEKAIEVLKTIFGIKVVLPQSRQSKTLLLVKEEDQANLLKAFEAYWVSR